MDTTGWTALVVAAIGAIGTVVLQALQMYFSYKRDTAIKADVATVVKATNGMTEKLVTAELVAERLVTKAEHKAESLIVTAAKTASEVADKVADKVAEILSPHK